MSGPYREPAPKPPEPKRERFYPLLCRDCCAAAVGGCIRKCLRRHLAEESAP